MFLLGIACFNIGMAVFYGAEGDVISSGIHAFAGVFTLVLAVAILEDE